MKKSKVMVCVILALIMMMTTACANIGDTDTKCAMAYSMKEYVFPEKDLAVDDFCFTEIIGGMEKAIELSEDDNARMEKINRGLFDFLVEKYDLDWEYNSVKVLVMDFSKVAGGEYAYYGAMADPDCGVIYLNMFVLQTSKDIIYRAVHEFIHCMVYNNYGTVNFAIFNEDGDYIGYYASEAITDLIAVDFLKAEGEKDALDYFLKGSNYCYTMVALQILEHSVPDMKKMFLNMEAEKFCKEITKLGEMHIEDGESVDYGMVFLYQADVYQAYSTGILYATTIEDYTMCLNKVQSAMFGNFEIVCAISDGLDAKEEMNVVKYIEYVFELEGTGELMAEYIEYFRECMK